MFGLLGTIANTAAIIGGSLFGLLLKGGIPEKINDTVMKGLALFVMLIGISGALKTENMILAILSIVIGGIAGEIIDIDKRLQKFGDIVEKKFKGRGGKISEAFVTSSLLFCVGAMAIVGSLESGLTGNHKLLLTKSVLDGVSAIIFTSSMGIGVLLSSAAVFIYQGFITLAASVLKSVLVASVINEMTAVGSLLIIGMGLNMLGTTKIKAANLLPAIFIPVLYQIFSPAFISIYQWTLSMF